MYPEFPVFLMALALFLPSVNSDRNEYCYEKCMTDRIRLESSKTIDAYLEYEKVVVKVEPNEVKLTSTDPEPLIRRHSRDLTYPRNASPIYVDPQPGNEGHCKSKSKLTKVGCRPRPLIVDVVVSDPRMGKIIQEKVVTKKCTGLCNRNRSCVAVRTINETIPVQLKQPDGTIKCYNIRVPFDKKCKCQCTVKPEQCKENQKFDKENCACSCINQKEATDCQKRIEKENKLTGHVKHFWNHQSCSCDCLEKHGCTTGTVWNNQQCGCTKKTDKG